MQALGSVAADFNLPNLNASQASKDDGRVSLSQLHAKPLLVMFICNHCPYVIHIAERMTELANSALEKGFAVVAISANDAINYPQDGPQAMTEFAHQYGFNFAYLYDQSQAVAKAYAAACTPDFFVFDADHRLKYRGQMDGSRPGSGLAVSGDELAAAIDAVIDGRAVSESQTPSIGCNIKWKAGNEPDYF
ncbi:MAG: peroxiredoxin [Arenicella sp.]|jgi:peroxiredoxin